jgi:hypothetical protein
MYNCKSVSTMVVRALLSSGSSALFCFRPRRCQSLGPCGALSDLYFPQNGPYVWVAQFCSQSPWIPTRAAATAATARTCLTPRLCGSQYTLLGRVIGKGHGIAVYPALTVPVTCLITVPGGGGGDEPASAPDCPLAVGTHCMGPKRPDQ